MQSELKSGLRRDLGSLLTWPHRYENVEVAFHLQKKDKLGASPGVEKSIIT